MTENPAANDKPPFTHTAWIFKTDIVRQGRRLGRWLAEGVARFEPDGSVNVYLHSLPIGGFNGRIHLAKIGANPPDIMSMPKRPESTTRDDDGEGYDE